MQRNVPCFKIPDYHHAQNTRYLLRYDGKCFVTDVPTFRNKLLSSTSHYIPLKCRKITYSTSRHTTVTLAFSEVPCQVSQLLYDGYQMLLRNWQHLLHGHLGYGTLLQSRYAVSLSISPQYGS